MKTRYFEFPKQNYYKHLVCKWIIATTVFDKDTIGLITDSFTCRDELLEHSREIAQFPEEAYGKHGMQFDEASLLYYCRPTTSYSSTVINNARKRMLKGLNAGIAIAGLFEDRAGWDNTEIYIAKSKKDPCAAAYNIVGPPQWIASSFSLSLYILLLRIGNIKELQQEFESIEELQKVLKKVATANKTTDAGHIQASYKHWLTFIDNYKFIFKGRTAKTNHGIKVIKRDRRLKLDLTKKSDIYEVLDNAYGDGITTLVSGRCSDTIIKNRFKSLIKPKKKKQAAK